MFDKIIDLLKPFLCWEGLVAVVVAVLFVRVVVVRLGDWIAKNS